MIISRGAAKAWTKCGNVIPGNPAYLDPVDGIYIGYRTFSNGTVSYDYSAESVVSLYRPEAYFEAWLIVPSERENPAPVLPEDVEICEDGGRQQ